jgi:hypothetical protein
VVGPAGRRDVVAAADASLVYLRPVLVDMVGRDRWPRDSPRWRLVTAEGRPLVATRSLAANGVVDGQLLFLSASPGDTPEARHE